MNPSGAQALLDVALSYITDREEISSAALKSISDILLKLFNGIISINQATTLVNQIVVSQQPMQKIATILSVGEDPIPVNPRGISECMARHKTRPWMSYEDQRLLAAIWRYGLDNWLKISEFVGNGRTRSQCSQRWNRGLNPKISKGAWTKDDEEKLLKLVNENGDKSWTKIAMEFGNRSDVQCRYKYQQLLKDNTEGNNDNHLTQTHHFGDCPFTLTTQKVQPLPNYDDSDSDIYSRSPKPSTPNERLVDFSIQNSNYFQNNSQNIENSFQNIQNNSNIIDYNENDNFHECHYFNDAELFSVPSENNENISENSISHNQKQDMNCDIYNHLYDNSPQNSGIFSFPMNRNIPKITLPEIDPSVFVEW
ncbi:Myb-like DNA-binding domain containing protein [Tritrichomonas foetus]|uniref:Myb-like DNA-binding domain containing protein n=1 Tax=Tritrichomonas foetus TaxID=1144522 RepID=A0A1J4JT35_9EUKA|nr:Myb-like DNA-binding domain containing protein [Tritrichomonas foetus]|eukprot:OHT00660.1 Myb-like DNA-binding domain containing protein [Tritrichomonas foetus]